MNEAMCILLTVGIAGIGGALVYRVVPIRPRYVFGLGMLLGASVLLYWMG